MLVQKNAHEAALVEIQLLPLEDDLDTIATVGLVSDRLIDEVSALEHYRLEKVVPAQEAQGHKTRSDVAFFHLMANLLQYGPQSLVMLLIASGLTALRLLLKQRRVKKVEVKVGNKTMVVENADQHVVETSLRQFEEICKQESKALTTTTSIEIKAYVSKKNNPAKQGKSEKKEKSDIQSNRDEQTISNKKKK